jgi:hypothetical protein
MAKTVRMAAYADNPYLIYGQRRRTGPLAITIIILVHAVLLWFLLKHTMFFERTHVRGGMITYVRPMSVNKPTAVAKRTPRKSIKQTVTVPNPNAPRQVLVHRQPPAPTITAQSINAPQVVAKAEAPPEDMMAQIDAARRRRAAQQPPNASGEQEESEGQRANRIARANIARAVGAGQDREDAGGMFQVRNKTFDHAEISFRGWNTNFKHNWSQLIKVEQGNERDIEVAVVKKMIEIIRQHKTDEFVWESHRLGRNVTLSARVQDSLMLQNFLLHEFFPEHPSLTAKS